MRESFSTFATLRGLATALDSDPAETAEWLESIESVFRHAGADRAEFILSALERKAKEIGVFSDVLPYSPYRNTIPLERQPPFGQHETDFARVRGNGQVIENTHRRCLWHPRRVATTRSRVT